LCYEGLHLLVIKVKDSYDIIVIKKVVLPSQSARLGDVPEVIRDTANGIVQLNA